MNIHNESDTEAHKNMHTLHVIQENDVESRLSPQMGTSPHKSGSDTEAFPKNQTRNTPVQCFNDSRKSQPEKQETRTTQNLITVEMKI